MNKAEAPYFAGRRVLLLQGPVGPFFRRLADELLSLGAASVHKMNFNGGDWLFYQSGAQNYRGKLEDWPLELERRVVEWRIDTLVLFGDCRPIHLPVHEMGSRINLHVWVFEKGYVRPNYVTFERHGVNNRSQLPREASYYLDQSALQPQPEQEVGNTFWHAALWASMYYLAACLLWPFFPRYQHHRRLSLLETMPWLRSVARKWVYRFRERGTQARLAGELSGQFFLVPLQVTTDSQVRVHSRFRSVHDFISNVVESFAHYAPKEAFLVFKHHPLDRGFQDYRQLFRQLAKNHCLGDRLLYIHDQHLPTLLSHARAVIVINSTVGLSALQHGKPTKVMGDVLYDLTGMTFQGSLQSFWTVSDTQPPCANLFHRFRTFLVHHTQINGSFYRYGIFDWSALRQGESMSKPWNEADVGRLLSPQRNPSYASSPAESNSAVVDPTPQMLNAS